MFAKRLKMLRESRGISQEELANVLMISASAVGMYEQGRREPDHDKLRALADYFSVSIDYLLGRDLIDVNLKVDAENVGSLADVERLAGEAMELLNQALAEGVISEEQAALSLKLFRQSLLIMMEEKKNK
jgi:transcriptional regulator with XRE-family HTH domain